MKLIERYYKIIIALLLIINTAFLSFIALNYTRCETEDCSLDRNANLMPDLFWRYNTIKYVSEHSSFPLEVADKEDGAQDGTALQGQDSREVWHSPLYYFLAAPIYKLALSLNLNTIIFLKLSSIFIMLLASLTFVLLLERLAEKLPNKKNFIVYALAIFLFLPTHLFTTITIGNDVLFYLFFILSIYFFINLDKVPTIKNSILLGVILGLALLSRQASIILSISLLIYILIKHFKKHYKERNFFLISLIISSILGLYPFIRNYLLFGKLLVAVREYETNLATFYRLFRGFWGGIYGGNDFIQPLLIISVIIISLLTLYGIFKAYKSKNRLYQTFFLITAFITILLAINFTCNFLTLLTIGQCLGDAALSRYLIPLQPIIAIFTSFSLISLEKNKILSIIIPIIVLSIIALFSIDFLYAFF